MNLKLIILLFIILLAALAFCAPVSRNNRKNPGKKSISAKVKRKENKRQRSSTRKPRVNNNRQSIVNQNIDDKKDERYQLGFIVNYDRNAVNGHPYYYKTLTRYKSRKNLKRMVKNVNGRDDKNNPGGAKYRDYKRFADFDAQDTSDLKNEEKFEALTEFFFIPNTQVDDSGRRQLRVKTSFGGKDRYFHLTKGWGETQIQISTVNEDYIGENGVKTEPHDGYNSIAKTLLDVDSSKKLTPESKKKLIQRRANLIRRAIGIDEETGDNLPMGESVAWEDDQLDLKDTDGKDVKVKVMNSQQIRDAVTLIAVSQVAEDAAQTNLFENNYIEMSKVSSDLSIQTRIKNANKERDPNNKVRRAGRIPGTSKYFRNVLKYIEDGKLDFTAFLIKEEEGLTFPDLNIAKNVPTLQSFYLKLGSGSMKNTIPYKIFNGEL